MPYVSHMFRQSNKLRNTSSLIRKDQAVLLRWFSSSSRPSVDNGNDLLKFHKHGSIAGGGTGVSMNFAGNFTISRGFSNCCSVSTSGVPKKLDAPVAGLALNQLISCSHRQPMRCFSANSDLPPHQEIGMPSLSPTMTEGNIARWLKKEGDKVAPGEVLCEVETDKATVEMECMEEGYIAKILHGDGSNSIKVGEVIAITVEEEEDIAKFKDFTPSASDAASKAAPTEPSSPTPPKETVQESFSSPEPAVSKPSATPASESRIFASPVARKLAEDHNVPLSSIKGTGPDGRIVKVDVEEFLASHSKEAPAAARKVDTATAEGVDYVDIPHSQIRKVILYTHLSGT
ncbi:hypothetical protein Leryth_025181 [Lithospermum erythrorhizon]|nr:hypothetical protein Leryth_025181 [Lithospermum erythrorhizon]